jgi:hypothetical protein
MRSDPRKNRSGTFTPGDGRSLRSRSRLLAGSSTAAQVGAQAAHSCALGRASELARLRLMTAPTIMAGLLALAAAPVEEVRT